MNFNLRFYNTHIITSLIKTLFLVHLIIKHVVSDLIFHSHFQLSI